MDTRNRTTITLQRNQGTEPAIDPAIILRRYQRRQTRKNATALIECYRRLVDRAIGHYVKKLPPNVDRQDLAQAGMFGLIQAARRFDESRGVPFESFAFTRIRGSIQDELRALDWMPRRNGNDAGTARLFMHLAGDLTGATAQNWQDAQDEERHDHSILDAIYKEELLERVQRSLTTLEWRLLHDSYIRGKTLKQVAQKMGMSTSYACTLRARILEKLRRQIEESALYDPE